MKNSYITLWSWITFVTLEFKEHEHEDSSYCHKVSKARTRVLQSLHILNINYLSMCGRLSWQVGIKMKKVNQVVSLTGARKVKINTNLPSYTELFKFEFNETLYLIFVQKIKCISYHRRKILRFHRPFSSSHLRKTVYDTV